MDIAVVLLIAMGLGMDCFAVSITSGAVIKKLRFKHALRMALAFGIFQAAMPVLGWFAGLGLASVVEAYDHWIAFCILAFIGAKMIYESREADCKAKDPFRNRTLLLLAVATSIDALAVGVTLAFLKTAIIVPVIIIGATAFAMSVAGLHIGRSFGHLFEKKIEVVGGLILIGIGAKILLESVV